MAETGPADITGSTSVLEVALEFENDDGRFMKEIRAEELPR
ncbi:hypothetical protein MBT84_08185 [Streptomyces sp. MBT84]|nr:MULTISPECIES: hypothetical protein [unclassified Streptomyces]MBW8699567.1 hypothetical protein [Streptomyces sp. MBT84]MDX3261016.1 hypothetical protein [Streptomyces sp. MI02-2A]REE64690.1 hypothetical protein BX257_7388 [Streptomyces sp. 3212.3]